MNFIFSRLAQTKYFTGKVNDSNLIPKNNVFGVSIKKTSST